jgi:general secretion pathway protein M
MTKSVSRWLAIALLVLVPVTIALPAISALLTWWDDVAQRAETASQALVKYGDQAGRVAALKDTLSALEASADDDRNLIAGATDALAAAALQTHAKQLVEASGGNIQSLQILPTKMEATLSRIGVRLQFTARSEDLQKIIYSIETTAPLLTVDALEIRQERLSAGTSGMDGQHEGYLIVQLEVSGFRRAERAL